MSEPLSWSLCIPTFNRHDVLRIAVQNALRQSRPPRQVIVVDAAPEWEEHRADLVALFDGEAAELIYEGAEKKASASQRNQAAARATSDILFFTDDDSFMFPDCAELVMRAYEADAEGAIAGIGLSHRAEIPPLAMSLLGMSTGEVDRKDGVMASNQGLMERLNRSSGLFRWFRREVLMMAMDRMFVPYDLDRVEPRGLLDAPGAELHHTRHLPGYGMTIRRAVFEQETFNPLLLAYCPCEDLDASYRWGRHGACVIYPAARLHHYAAKGGRIKRQQATMLAITNVALFLRMNSDLSARHRWAFRIFTARRLLGELLKDGMTGRYDFPQARGVLKSIPVSRQLLSRPDESLDSWYTEAQREILNLRG